MLETYKTAFGEKTMTSKFHMAMHLAMFLLNFGSLPCTITHERKHKVAKRFLNDLRNSFRLDRTIIRECTCHHLEYLRMPGRFGLQAGLEPPMQAAKGALLALLVSEFGNFPAVQNSQVSASARFSAYGRVHRGDVVAVRDIVHGLMVATVQRLVEVDCEILALGDLFSLASNLGDYGVWAKIQETYAWFVDVISRSLFGAIKVPRSRCYTIMLRQSGLIV